MPQTLSETGLYEDIASGSISPAVRAYQPVSELWSDGAVKKRWVYLPPGTTIDTTDMDYWEYPVGTRLWKQFTWDGVRVETRYLYKSGPSQWYVVAYAWRDDESDADVVPYGRPNVRGTGYDVPRAVDCLECHDGMPDKVLGFSAMQIDHDQGGLSLDDLVQEGLLSSPPAGTGTPYFPVPGDAVAQSALHYMNANCGGCHNPRSYVGDMSDVEIDLRLTVGQRDSVESTPAYSTTVGLASKALMPPPNTTAIIEPGDLEASALYQRVNSRGQTYSMPPVGTEVVDEAGGVAAIGAWIQSLAPLGTAANE